MTLTTTSQAASPATELACGTRDAAAACVEVLRDVVAGLDPDVVLATEAPEVWSLFDAGERLCAAAKVLVARRVDDSGVWRDAGMRSAAEYLALYGGTTRGAARDALKTSDRVASLPQVEDALRRGELSASQAHVIADAASHDPAAQPALLDQAKVGSFKELRDECLRRKAAADPKPQDTRDRICKERCFRLSTDAEGAWRLSGRGPLDHAGTFTATLNPLIDDEFTKARAEGRREERGALAYDALQKMARLAKAMYYGDDLPDDDTDVEITYKGEEADGAGGRLDTEPGQTGTSTRGREDRSGARHQKRKSDADRGSKRKRTKHNKRTNPSHLAILRLDVEALRRGYTEGDELCEVPGRRGRELQVLDAEGFELGAEAVDVQPQLAGG